ncbi:MAG: DUF1801 domain-containing protein [Anaerolineales bacterium]|nr:DUF1801 domain-containing protein [Anaerolineales bacterium]MBX3038158.1 DUF1801 domain-containing protein [Anaerolineales bacterium]
MAKKVELKTKKNEASVEDFLNFIVDEQKRKDCFEIAKMMEKAIKQKPKMWGPSIVGFGEYHYKYASGHEGDMPIIAFSPRKQNITLYIMESVADNPLIQKLGKYKTSKACLYIKKLADVDKNILQELINESAKENLAKYGG